MSGPPPLPVPPSGAAGVPTPNVSGSTAGTAAHDSLARALADRRLRSALQRLADEARAMGEADASGLAERARALLAHAALAPACDPLLLHLLRLNFFYDGVTALPAWIEPRLLLLPLWEDAGDGLYRMAPALRGLLLRELAAHQGQARLVEVATLLWRHAERRIDWADRTALRHALQLTALNFLAPQLARQWLDQARGQGRGDTLDDSWFVAMRDDLPDLAPPVVERGDPVAAAQALLRLKWPRHRESRLLSGQSCSVWLIHDPPGYLQELRLFDLLGRGLVEGVEPQLFEFAVETDAAGQPTLRGGRSGGAEVQTIEPWIRPDDQPLRLPPHTVVAIHRAQRLPLALWTPMILALRRCEWVVLLSERVIEETQFTERITRGLMERSPDPLFMFRLPEVERFWPDAPAGFAYPFIRAMRPNDDAIGGVPADEFVTYTSRAKAESDGLPERFVQSLCRQFGVRWPEVMDRLRRRYAPRPALTPQQQLQQLAVEYDRVRAAMPSGNARTREMTEVASKMLKVLEPLADPLDLTPLMPSVSAGSRLVATLALQTAPRLTAHDVDWLTERATDDQPFVGYHALRALLHGMQQADDDVPDHVYQLMLNRIAAVAEVKMAGDQSRLALVQRLNLAWKKRRPARMLPLVLGTVVLPGVGRLLNLKRDRGLAAEARQSSEFLVAYERGDEFATRVTVHRDGVDLGLRGVERVRLDSVELEPKRSMRLHAAWSPFPEDPTPESVGAEWIELLAALEALIRVIPEFSAARDWVRPREIGSLYAMVAALPEQPRVWREMLVEQDRRTKLGLAMDAIHNTFIAQLQLPPPKERILARRRIEPLLARPGFARAAATGTERWRDSRRLAAELTLDDARSPSAAAALLMRHPEDDELWSLLSPWLPQPRSGPSPLRLWPNGSTLRIRLIRPTDQQRDLVYRHSKAWLDLAHLHALFVDERDPETADIRIAFDRNEGSWSYLGTEARSVDKNKPTMNLGWLGIGESEAAERGSILKEFGHALGLIQEHQNPNARIAWDIDGLRTAENSPFRHQTPAQVQQFVRRHAAFDYRPFDVDSVMLWPIAAEWVLSRQAFGGATELSASDKALIARLYPKPMPKPAPTSRPKPATMPKPTPKPKSKAAPKPTARPKTARTKTAR